jgi:hypothetical protein
MIFGIGCGPYIDPEWFEPGFRGPLIVEEVVAGEHGLYPPARIWYEPVEDEV